MRWSTATNYRWSSPSRPASQRLPALSKLLAELRVPRLGLGRPRTTPDVLRADKALVSVKVRLGFDEAVAYALGETRQSTVRGPIAARGIAMAGPLTRREREIAELITRGLSNREIASTLVISQRTAEGHVEHILTKLGFTSRAQVAAWVTEHRATPGRS
jgi:DNA-binding CsgD family transcriptional regulator